MKFRYLAVAVAAFAMAGTAAAQDTSTEKGKVSYAMGYQLGAQAVGYGETLDSGAVLKGLNDALAKKQPSVPEAQLDAAMKSFNTRIAAREKAEWDKMAAANLVESNKFLTAYKSGAGVQSLANGVMYKVITAGKGAKPTANSTVNLQLAGPFPLGNRPQDAQQAAARPVNDMKLSSIPLVGLRTALMAMPVGSKWEVVLPPSQAYGADPGQNFPPNAAITYEVTLVSSK